MTDTITTADGHEALILNLHDDAAKAYRANKGGTEASLLNIYHNNWFGICSATAAMPSGR